MDVKELPPPGMNNNLPGLNPARDRYLLTADANIIHASWSARFQIDKPELYYQSLRVPADPAGPDEIVVDDGMELGRRGPRTLLGKMLESAIITATAGWTVDEILYTRQTEYRQAVERLYRQMVENLNIGVSIEEVRINGKVMTPAVTQPFFDALTAARAEQGTMIDKAHEYGVSTAAQASEESSRIIAGAENYRTMVVANVKAESLYFESFLQEYNANPRTALMSRYNAVLAEVLSGIDQKFVLGAKTGGKVWLKLNQEVPKAADKNAAGEKK
ncbi:Modulator of FtsH protease HflK [bioreactor metagenome]|uniref:Modulator of FtsH protease HflK n=1 Tax=bioreactor metagenome TaxID=1076179 RepID=A0A645DSZ6_9ZZZZ